MSKNNVLCVTGELRPHSIWPFSRILLTYRFLETDQKLKMFVLVAFDLLKRKFFFLLLIFYIFFGPNLRLNVREKLVISPKMFIIINNIIITIIIIIITIIINIISFVSLCYCSFCTSAGRKPCTWSISHSSQSVCSHTISTFLRIRADPNM